MIGPNSMEAGERKGIRGKFVPFTFYRPSISVAEPANSALTPALPRVDAGTRPVTQEAKVGSLRYLP